MSKPKFRVGDKAYKPNGYKFPCTIVSVFETVEKNIRVVAEMDEYGLLHIFNENQLELLVKEKENDEKIELTKEELENLFEFPPKDFETEFQKARRMGRNSMIIELIIRYESK